MRKRGRSNGSYKRDRINPADSELKRLQNELNAFIDRQMPGENIKNTKQGKVILLIYDPERSNHSCAENLGLLFGITRRVMQTLITRLFDGERNKIIGRPS